jgi:cell shape-determining protein MreD
MTKVVGWLGELRRRNAALYYFGWLCWLGALVSAILIRTSTLRVEGTPAAIKPFKFFLSIAIAVWTLGWLLEHLLRRRAVRQYNVATIAAMSIELLIICGQAARGRMSHFNEQTLTDMILFQVMGITITAFTVWTAVIAGHFFRHHKPGLAAAYLWGIRIGLLCFVIFALEGGIMGAILRHSVGGVDNASGLPLLGWNRQYGDLRIAHFMGIHALQVLPLSGYLFQDNKRRLFLFAACYIGTAAVILIVSLCGRAIF